MADRKKQVQENKVQTPYNVRERLYSGERVANFIADL